MLSLLKTRVLRKIFVPRRGKRNKRMVKTAKSGKRIGICGKHSEKKGHRNLVGKTGRRRTCRKARRSWKNTMNEFGEVAQNVVYWIHLDKNKTNCRLL
jgi:hypothetical protein